jgi:hypothetical protein
VGPERSGELRGEALAGKDPSDAWQHRFKTLARAARINDSVADAIVGHAPDSVAKAYGTVTLATMKEALDRISF